MSDGISGTETTVVIPRFSQNRIGKIQRSGVSPSTRGSVVIPIGSLSKRKDDVDQVLTDWLLSLIVLSKLARVGFSPVEIF